MDPLTLAIVAALVSGVIGTIRPLIEKYRESGGRYADVLKEIDRILSGRAAVTVPLEDELNSALQEFSKSSQKVSSILSHVQAEVDKRHKEAEQMRATIDDLKTQYEANKSLANMSAQQADAVRQVLTKEVSVLKRRSYWPDIFINVGVGAVFFLLGLLANRYLRAYL